MKNLKILCLTVGIFVHNFLGFAMGARKTRLNFDVFDEGLGDVDERE